MHDQRDSRLPTTIPAALNLIKIRGLHFDFPVSLEHEIGKGSGFRILGGVGSGPASPAFGHLEIGRRDNFKIACSCRLSLDR